jgi:hypothetical protein
MAIRETDCFESGICRMSWAASTNTTFRTSPNSPKETPLRTKIRTSGLMRDRKVVKSVVLKFSLIPNPMRGGSDQIATAADMLAYC